MTVNTSDITSGPYSGNDVTTEFSYDFRVDSKTQLIVYETDDLGVETVLTVDTNYTVAGIGNDAGGTITRVAGALPTGYTWYIRSNYQPTQLTSFPSQGGFFPAVHESAFDKITFLIQQILDRVSRSLRLSDSYSGSASTQIPDPVALRYLRWNSDASAIELSEGSAQALASQVVSDDGNVQTDIDGLQTDVSRRIVTFDTVAAMVSAAFLTVGDKVRTLGYYTQGDGGGNDYEVVAAATGTDDGGSYIDLTGISGQAKGLFVDGIVEAAQFGAYVDGATDSYTAIVSALAYVPTTLYLRTTYFSSTIIPVPSGKRIIGGGLKNKGLSLTGSNHVLDVTFYGNSYAMETACQVAGDDVLIKDCRFSEVKNNAISGTTGNSKIRVLNNYFDDIGDAATISKATQGMALYLSQCEDILIQGNAAYRTRGTAAFTLSDCVLYTVSDNHISNVAWRGIEVFDNGVTTPAKIVIDGNVITKCGGINTGSSGAGCNGIFIGITSDDPSLIIVSNNNISFVAENGIEGNGTITGNTISDTGAYPSLVTTSTEGIYVSRKAIVTNNVIQNPDGRGIIIDAIASVINGFSVEGNYIFAPGRNGISVFGNASPTTITNVSIKNNMILDPAGVSITAYGLQISTTGGTTVDPETVQVAGNIVNGASWSSGLDIKTAYSWGNNDDLNSIDGTWDGLPLYLNGYALWVDGTGDLRIVSGAPASDTDGVVVGTQT